MKKIYIFLIYFIFCKYINASEVKLIIWSPEYVCIYNNLINEDDYKKVINNVICPFNTKIEGFYTKDSLENIIFMEYPVMSKFIIYIGSEISDNSTLEYNTEILRKYSQKNIFFIEYNTGYSYIKSNDSTIIQTNNIDNHIYKAETDLANGKWYLFGLLNHHCSLLTELIIKDNKVNGYMREYEYENISREYKYKNGVMVDTLKYFNVKGKLNGYELRDNEGQKIYFSCGFHSDSEKIAWCYDYRLNYQFTFFENGQISSMVRMKNGNMFGIYLEFDENSNIIFRKTYE